MRHSLKEDESGLARCREEGRKEGREREKAVTSREGREGGKGGPFYKYPAAAVAPYREVGPAAPLLGRPPTTDVSKEEVP